MIFIDICNHCNIIAKNISGISPFFQSSLAAIGTKATAQKVATGLTLKMHKTNNSIMKLVNLGPNDIALINNGFS